MGDVRTPSATPGAALPTPASSSEAAAAVLELLERQLPESSTWVVEAGEPGRALRIVDTHGDSEHALEVETRGEPVEGGVVEIPPNPEDGTGAFMAVPLLLSDGSSGGTLCAMARGGRAYGDDERRLIERSAGLLAYAIEREREAATDPLTGVANRRSFTAAVEREWARRRRESGASLVCVIDVDGFKEINDSLGHAAGDRVLQLVAQTLGEASRASDCVGRIGGDEFAVLLTDSGAAAAGAAFEWRVRAKLRELAAAGDPRADLSFGFEALTEAESAEAAIESADRAMYQNRAAHRERRLAGAARTVSRSDMAKDRVAVVVTPSGTWRPPPAP